MSDVIVYVDGFNLYYKCLKRTPYKWLDLGALCTTMLPNDRVIAINYYTGPNQRPARQPERTNGPADPPACAPNHSESVDYVWSFPHALRVDEG